MSRTISHLEWVVFDQWGQKMAFFNKRANGNIFRVKKSLISLWALFLGHPQKMNIFSKTIQVILLTLLIIEAENEWRRKGTNQEKSVRVVKLLDINVEPDAVFKVKLENTYVFEHGRI